MSVIKVHENVDEIERALRRAFPTIKRVISHAEPPARNEHASSFSFRTCACCDPRFSVGQDLFRINELLTLDSPENWIQITVIRKQRGALPNGCKTDLRGGQGHGARACGERVRPIRFDQGIGAIDRETGLPPAVDRRACAAPRRADPDHRLPDHHLPRRLRAGGRPEPAEARRHQARPRGARRFARRAPRPPRLGPAGSRAPISSGCRACCPTSFRPGASPPAATSSSPAPTSAFSPASRSTASARPTAFSTSSAPRSRWPRPAQQGIVTDMILPNGSGALAIPRW